MHMSFVHTGSYAPVSDIPPPLFHFFLCSLSPIFTPFIIPPKGSQFTVTKRLGYYDNPWALFTTNAGFERSCAGQFNVKCYYVTEEDTSYIIVKQSFKHNHSAVNNSVLDIIYSNCFFKLSFDFTIRHTSFFQFHWWCIYAVDKKDNPLIKITLIDNKLLGSLINGISPEDTLP